MLLYVVNISNTIIINHKYFLSDYRKMDLDTWTNCGLNGLNEVKLIQSFPKYGWNSVGGWLIISKKITGKVPEKWKKTSLCLKEPQENYSAVKII